MFQSTILAFVILRWRQKLLLLLATAAASSGRWPRQLLLLFLFVLGELVGAKHQRVEPAGEHQSGHADQHRDTVQLTKRALFGRIVASASCWRGGGHDHDDDEQNDVECDRNQSNALCDEEW